MEEKYGMKYRNMTHSIMVADSVINDIGSKNLTDSQLENISKREERAKVEQRKASIIKLSNNKFNTREAYTDLLLESISDNLNVFHKPKYITKKLNKFIIAGRIPNQPNIRINNY